MYKGVLKNYEHLLNLKGGHSGVDVVVEVDYNDFVEQLWQCGKNRSWS